MKTTLRIVFALLLSRFALTMKIPDNEETCANMEVIGAYRMKWRQWKDSKIIENKIIIAYPGDDTALWIDFPDVTIRNCIVYHPANGRGIYGQRSHNLRIENVEVIAYGNDWGAQPCPNRWPNGGYDCSNIVTRKTNNVRIHNVRVENGSKGIRLVESPDSHVSHVVAKNFRGPYPGGGCFAFTMSHRSVLDDFYCHNDPDISWTGDSMNMWRSSEVTISNGLINGSNAPTGMCIMFEGSDPAVHGGLIENVEAINCLGCFSGYPANGLRQNNVTCANQACPS